MKIGYIGVGNMGGGMAKSCLRARFDVTVSDLSRQAAQSCLEAGAKWADTPAEVAAASDIVFTSLPGPPAVEAVVYGPSGIAQGIRSGSVYVDMTTSSPTLIRKIHADFKPRGVDVLDAAVSGLISDAHSGNLATFVGGDEAVFKRVEPVLKEMGPRVNYMGAVGSGMVTKIVHNQICLGVISVMVEGFTLGKKAGVDLEALYQAIAGGVFGRGELIKIMPAVVFPGNFENNGRWGMPLTYGRKDIGLATELGRQLNVPLNISSLVEQDFITSIAHGLGEKESTIFTTNQEQRAAVSLRVGPKK
jgi:3-hydroxyisobutyrate dehydrogenase-like beta-hydroxyacid dehydrogenase